MTRPRKEMLLCVETELLLPPTETAAAAECA